MRPFSVTANELNGPLNMLYETMSKISHTKLTRLHTYIDNQIFHPKEVAEELDLLSKILKEIPDDTDPK